MEQKKMRKFILTILALVFLAAMMVLGSALTVMADEEDDLLPA